MRNLRVFGVLGVACIALVGRTRAQGASPAAAVIHIRAAAIAAGFHQLAQAQHAAPGGPVALELAIDTAAHSPRYRYWVASRQETGAAEIHDRWTDVVFVQSGTAVLRTGPRLSDGRLEAPHEWRGAVIEQPQDRQVGPGDVLIIPAGVAHQYRPTGAGPFTYQTVKVPPGSSPIHGTTGR